jgi:hypothetical protein
MSMIGRWLEEHGSELDALVEKIGKETGRRTTVEGVACDMLDQRSRFSSTCTRSKPKSNPRRIRKYSP